MKKINGAILEFILSIISLYCREKTLVTCDGVFCGYAYGAYPVRRYLWTGIIIAFVLFGMMEG